MKRKSCLGQTLLIIFFVILCIGIIFPFLLMVSVSFSNETDIVNYGYKLIPKRIDLTAYKYVWKSSQQIFNAYKVTFIFCMLNMILGVLFMAMLAYPLSRKQFKDRNIISFLLYFTMLFNGGLVPTYILITQYLHLDNTILVYILPSLISPWYVFMMRTFFTQIPVEIIESATIDGASEYKIFFSMILPLSKPILATVSLFVFLASWNNWMTSLLYIDDEKLISLQYLLQRIMENIKILQERSDMLNGMTSKELANIPSETVRMAMAIVVAGPALVVFPFFQKYFVKGLTVGAVKG